MTKEAIAIDPKLRAATLAAIAIGAANAKASARTEANIEKRYNSAHMLKLAQSASLNEITITLKSAAMREKALARLRTEDFGPGAALLATARDIYKNEELGREVMQSADSFQFAAEAYLHYKRKEYRRAEVLLLHSINACEILHVEYGHDIEIRRIHLAANVVRVKRLARSPNQALKLAADLIAYLYEPDARWPLPHDVSDGKVKTLDLLEVLGLADQIVDAVSFSVTSSGAKLEDQEIDQSLVKFGRTEAFPQSILNWLRSQKCLARGDAQEAVVHAIGFFNGNQGLPRLTRRLRSQLEPILNASAT